LIKFTPFRGLLEDTLAAIHDGWLILSTFRAEPAHDIDNQAYQQNQANPAAANEGTTKVKPTTTEQ